MEDRWRSTEAAVAVSLRSDEFGVARTHQTRPGQTLVPEAQSNLHLQPRFSSLEGMLRGYLPRGIHKRGSAGGSSSIF
jgi:hypothetical protein